MNEATINMILALLPVAQRMFFEVGGKIIELNTAEVKSRDELIAAIEKSKSVGWPELKFASSIDVTEVDAGAGD